MIFALFILFLLALLYLLPSIAAYQNESNIRESVLIVNLFFGWTLIGWVISLAMAYTGIKRKKKN